MNFFNMDAETSLFLQRELQVVERTILTTPRPPMVASQLMPVNASIPSGAAEWGFERYREVGHSRWASSNARDMPVVGIDKSRAMFPLETLWDGYKYTWEDLERAKMLKMPLDAQLGLTARYVLERDRNRVWLIGAPEKGFKGFLNDPLIPVITPIVGDWDGTGASTVEQILEAMHTAVAEVGTNNQRSRLPDTMALPPRAATYLQTALLTAQAGTLMQSFLGNSGQIKTIIVVDELATAGAGGTGRAVIYAKDPAVVEAMGTDAMLVTLPPQVHGLEWQVPMLSRFGGVAWKEPVSAVYVDGVTDA